MSSESNINAGLSSGARAGAIASAAVTGAMLGFGLRAGMAARPFNAAAALLLGDRARGVWGFVAGVSLVGEVVVVASCVLAGALCGALMRLPPIGRRARHPRLIAFAVSLAAAVVTLLILAVHAPDFVGPAPDGAITIAEGALLSIVVSIAYASGMGLAR